MPTNLIIGEFEQLLLLCLLNLEAPYAINLRGKLNEVAGRQVSRGAVYKTLDRLEQKGLVSWRLETAVRERAGYPRRAFSVTAEGLAVLRRSRETLTHLWSTLEGVL